MVPDHETLGVAKVLSDDFIAFVIISNSESFYKMVTCIEPNIGGFQNKERSRIVLLNVLRWSSRNIHC